MLESILGVLVNDEGNSFSPRIRQDGVPLQQSEAEDWLNDAAVTGPDGSLPQCLYRFWKVEHPIVTDLATAHNFCRKPLEDICGRC